MKFIGNVLAGAMKALLSLVILILKMTFGALRLFMLMFLLLARLVLIFVGAVA